MPINKLSHQIAARVETIRWLEREKNPHGTQVATGERNLADIARLCREFMPSGSGFDAGTRLDEDRSTGSKLVFTTSFHHMDDHGSYDGWTEHVVTVTATFTGMEISVSGRNRNGIKDYIADTFHAALDRKIDGIWDNEAKRFSFHEVA